MIREIGPLRLRWGADGFRAAGAVRDVRRREMESSTQAGVEPKPIGPSHSPRPEPKPEPKPGAKEAAALAIVDYRKAWRRIRSKRGGWS